VLLSILSLLLRTETALIGQVFRIIFEGARERDGTASQFCRTFSHQVAVVLRQLECTIYRLRFTIMNYRAIACRKKAGQFERAAKVATSHDVCRVYLDVARQWRDRAEYTEELERLPTRASKNGSTIKSRCARHSISGE
jgi:hypothetical protein